MKELQLVHVKPNIEILELTELDEVIFQSTFSYICQ